MASSKLRAVTRLGVRRGLFHGSRFWLYVGLGAWSARALGRVVTRRPLVCSEKLRPGEQMLISHVRRQRT